MRFPIHNTLFDALSAVWGKDLISTFYTPVSTVRTNLCG